MMRQVHQVQINTTPLRAEQWLGLWNGACRVIIDRRQRIRHGCCLRPLPQQNQASTALVNEPQRRRLTQAHRHHITRRKRLKYHPRNFSAPTFIRTDFGYHMGPRPFLLRPDPECVTGTGNNYFCLAKQRIPVAMMVRKPLGPQTEIASRNSVEEESAGQPNLRRANHIKHHIAKYAGSVCISSRGSPYATASVPHWLRNTLNA